MSKVDYELSAQTKGQLLRQLRTAVFYQIELSNTASSIKESLSACHEGDWDTEHRLGQIRLELGDRIVTDGDVETFVADLQDNFFPQSQAFSAVLDKQTKVIVKQKLQRAVWIQNELWKTVDLMAETLRDRTEDLIFHVQEFSSIADSGCELVESDLDFFLGDAPPGTVKQGHPLYV